MIAARRESATRSAKERPLIEWELDEHILIRG